MREIADADELERELHRLLAYTQGEQPSRSLLATELGSLSQRLSRAQSSFEYDHIYGQIEDIMGQLQDVGQTVMSVLKAQRATIDSSDERAYGSTWSALLKAHSALKSALSSIEKLPSQRPSTRSR